MMTLLTWSHECIVGVQAMDDQHGILMDTLNELRIMLLHGGTRQGISLQLERLIDLTHMHFQSEEQLLQRENFPGFEDHRTAHMQLLGRLCSALEQVNHDKALHFPSLLAFLPAWYRDHLEQLDRPYGVWLNDRGVY
jgi:hemerythrin-like metal-binding protein